MPPKGQSGTIQSVDQTPFNHPTNLGPNQAFEAVGPTFQSVSPTGTPQAAAAAAAAPPPMPAPTYDATYNVDVAEANNIYGQGMADIDTGRGRLGFDSGFNADMTRNALNPYSDIGVLEHDYTTSRDRLGFDSGYTLAGEIDMRNPYSQAMALQRHYQQSQRGTNTSYAARGQLRSGAYQRAQGENTYAFDRDTAGLKESTRRGMSDMDYSYGRGSAGIAENARRGFEDYTTDEQNLGANYGTGQGGVPLGTAQQRAGANQATRWQDQENDWYSLYGRPNG